MASDEPRAGSRKERTAKGLRMKELSAATGLPKSAILHYVSQGLLPEPVKTSRNMAYYAPECVERIAFIKSLQERYSFPLGKIRGILASRDEGRDPARIIELCEVIFQGRMEAEYDRKAFCEATGLKSWDLKSLQDSGLLLPLDGNGYDRQDVAVGTIYANGLAMGLKVADLAFYAEAAQRLVKEEMDLRKRLTRGLSDERDAEMSTRLVQAARQIRTYLFDRSFQRYVTEMAALKEEDKP